MNDSNAQAAEFVEDLVKLREEMAHQRAQSNQATDDVFGKKWEALWQRDEEEAAGRYGEAAELEARLAEIVMPPKSLFLARVTILEWGRSIALKSDDQAAEFFEAVARLLRDRQNRST